MRSAIKNFIDKTDFETRIKSEFKEPANKISKIIYDSILKYLDTAKHQGPFAAAGAERAYLFLREFLQKDRDNNFGEMQPSMSEQTRLSESSLDEDQVARIKYIVHQLETNLELKNSSHLRSILFSIYAEHYPFTDLTKRARLMIACSYLKCIHLPANIIGNLLNRSSMDLAASLFVAADQDEETFINLLQKEFKISNYDAAKAFFNYIDYGQKNNLIRNSHLYETIVRQHIILLRDNHRDVTIIPQNIKKDYKNSLALLVQLITRSDLESVKLAIENIKNSLHSFQELRFNLMYAYFAKNLPSGFLGLLYKTITVDYCFTRKGAVIDTGTNRAKHFLADCIGKTEDELREFVSQAIYCGLEHQSLSLDSSKSLRELLEKAYQDYFNVEKIPFNLRENICHLISKFQAIKSDYFLDQEFEKRIKDFFDKCRNKTTLDATIERELRKFLDMSLIDRGKLVRYKGLLSALEGQLEHNDKLANIRKAEFLESEPNEVLKNKYDKVSNVREFSIFHHLPESKVTDTALLELMERTDALSPRVEDLDEKMENPFLITPKRCG